LRHDVPAAGTIGCRASFLNFSVSLFGSEGCSFNCGVVVVNCGDRSVGYEYASNYSDLFESYGGSDASIGGLG